MVAFDGETFDWMGLRCIANCVVNKQYLENASAL